MKKHHGDHVLRAAGWITSDRRFIVIGSQSLHATVPDLPDEISISAEVDLIASGRPDRTDLLNAIGQDSQFHETFGYYADPVDLPKALLPKGWQERLAVWPRGASRGCWRSS
jgi:hypothetical protein